MQLPVHFRMPSSLCGALGTLLLAVHPAIGQVFFEQSFYPSEVVAEVIAVGDLNGDGMSDLVTAGSEGSTISVRLSDRGQYAREVTYEIGPGQKNVVVDDVNGDARPDVVVSHGGLDVLWVLLNEGGGELGEPTTQPVGEGAGPIVVSDFDGDDDRDVAVAVTISGEVWVYFNDGESLGSPSVVEVGNELSDIAAGDVDGDGDVDLAVTRTTGVTPEGWGDLVLLINDGNAGFSLGSTHVVGFAPSAVAIGDLNGDGEADMVATNGGGVSAAFLYNRGGGDFGDGTVNANQYFEVGLYPSDVSVCDFDQDGDRDPVIVSVFGVRVMLNEGLVCGGCDAIGDCCEGNGSPGCADPGCQAAVCDLDPFCCDTEWDQMCANLAAGVLFSSDFYWTDVEEVFGAMRIGLGDVDGDGLDDLAVTNQTAEYGYISILVNHGGGVYRSEIGYDVGDGVELNAGPVAVVAGDFDGDFAVDLATANPDTNDVSILFNDGDGLFGPSGAGGPANPINGYPVGDQPHDIATADVNGDEKLDLVVANRTSASISVLLGEGDGTFAPEQRFDTWILPVSVAVGDVDGDGDLDAVVGHEFGDEVSVLANNGDGTFATPVMFAAAPIPWSVSLGDLDADGDLDLTAVSRSEDTVAVLHNDGAGVFSVEHTYDVGLRPRSIVVADIDRDGDQDLAVLSEDDGVITHLSNTGDGSFLVTGTSAVRIGAQHVTAGDLDGDLDLDLVVANGDFTFSVLVNRDGAFNVVHHRTRAWESAAVVLADLDGNGSNDLAIADSYPDLVVVAHNVFPAQSTCAADADGDGQVTPSDLAFLLGQWGPCMACDSDLNGDGVVGIEDLMAVLIQWGSCP